jgi:CHAT domain-containing protein
MVPTPRGRTSSRIPLSIVRDAALPLADTHTALIEYAVAPDSVALMLLREEGGQPRLRSVRVPLRQELLRQTVERLRRALESGSEIEEIQRVASRLYGWLLAPLEPHLNGVRRLVLCPDGILHALPWSVLYAPSKGYLVQRFALTVAPSATLWQRHIGWRRCALPYRAARCSLPSPSSVGETRARGLPCATYPVWQRSARCCSDCSATRCACWAKGKQPRTQVLTQLPHASLIHFATHAVTNARIPLLSGLALAPQGSNRWLSGYDVLSVRLRARLTVLSACSTAEGVLSGDGQVGLAWAFSGGGLPHRAGDPLATAR